MFREFARILDALLPLAEGPQAVDVLSLAGRSRAWGAQACPRMQAVLDRCRERAEKALLRDPHDPGLHYVDFLLSRTGDGYLKPPEGCVPLPGEMWPPSDYLREMLAWLEARREPPFLLEATEALAVDPPAGPWNPEAWRDQCAFLRDLHLSRARALAATERRDESRVAFLEARRWGGPLWGTGVSGLGFTRTEEESLAEALHRPDPAPPPLPRASFRLVLLGDPVWRMSLAGMSQSRDLAPWSAEEFRVEIPGPLEAEAIRRLGHWGAEARWALLRGGTILDSGQEAPAFRTLATDMERWGPSRLQALGALLSMDPGHLAAHRARFELLLKRMPNPALEPLLALDAREAFIPPPFEPEASWHPDPDLWQKTALLVLPVLEAQLRRWPMDDRTWKAWAAWSRFHPDKPSVLSLARNLPLRPGLAPTSLPPAAQEAVASEFRRLGDPAGMRAWFLAALEGMEAYACAVEDPVRPGPRRAPGPGMREAVLAPLREALKALGRPEELREVEERAASLPRAPRTPPEDP
jgi:hypothetical protein